MSVGTALQELIRMTPQKYDPQALQALLIQVRRDAVGTNRLPILDPTIVDLSARRHRCAGLHAATSHHASPVFLT